MTTNPEFLTIAATAAFFGVSRQSIYNWIAAGAISTVRIGPRTVRVTRAEIDRFIAARTKRVAQPVDTPVEKPAQRRVAKRVLTPRTAAPQPTAG